VNVRREASRNRVDSHNCSSAKGSSLDQSNSNLADGLVHIQVLILVARNVARHQHHDDARDERADKEEPKPCAEELFLQGARAAVFDGLGVEGGWGDGGVDEDGDDAENLQSADDSGESAEGVSNDSDVCD
jgi:hypothetical protein